jgi:hypothetical protein
MVVEAFLRIPLERLEEITRDYESLLSGGAPDSPALVSAT